MTSEPRRIPDALLERYLTDALPAAEKARIEAILAASPQDHQQLAELRADSEAFFLRHPPGPLVARFQEQTRRARWWRGSMLLVPVLVAAGIALVVYPRPPPIEDPPYIPKGNGAVLTLHRKTAQGSSPVPPPGPLYPHDDVRFTVKGIASGFIAVLSRDGRGTITVYYPFGGQAAAPYDESQHALPRAIKLDDTLGPEDLYVLHSPQPFELPWAVQALIAGTLPQEAKRRDISVGHFAFEKRSPAQK
jgi:hypothetical protein